MVEKIAIMRIKLWLDDERDPKDPYIQSEFGAKGDEKWVKTASDAIHYLKQGNVTFISLDHDLGTEAGTGMEVAKYIEEQAFHGTLPRLLWSVHSLNIVGVKNMMNALFKANDFWRNHETSQ